MRRLLGLVLVLMQISCGDDTSSTDGDGTTGSTSTTGPLCEAGDVQPCDCGDGIVGEQECAQSGNEWLGCVCVGSGSSDESSTGGSLCGNGEVDGDEQCDDGNDDDADECSNDCIALCGVMWEAVYVPEMVGVNTVAQDADGNILVGGAQLDGENVIPFIETFGLDGASLGSVTFDIGVAAAGTASVLIDDRPGAFGFGELDVSGGEGLHFVDFDGSGVNVDVPVDPAVTLWQAADNALGVAATPDGNYVVSASIDVAEGDEDMWVAKIDASNGDVIWEATHSGPFEGGFSIDDGSRVAVGADGSVYAVGSLRKTFNRKDVVAVKFGPTGGDAEWEVLPVSDTANTNNFPIDIAVDADGNVYMSQISFFGASQAAYYTRIVDGEESWTLTNEDLGLPDDGDFDWPRIAIDGDGNLVLSIEHRSAMGRLGVVFGHVTPNAEVRCLERYSVSGSDRGAFRLSVLSDGSVAVVGPGDMQWAGRVRL